MSFDAKKEIYGQLRIMQDKYAYFLLAISASAIALSVQTTKDEIFSVNLISLGLANVCWALSFYFGCRYIEYMQSYLFANYDYLRIQNGEYEGIGSDKIKIEAASEGIRNAMEKNLESIQNSSILQFRFLVGGGIFYIIWHLIKIGIRTFE